MPRALHRLMTPLALVAMLLLATVPTLGRMAPAALGPDVAPTTAHRDGVTAADMAAMPTHAGTSMHHAAMHHASGHDAMAAMPARDAADPHAGHAPDCDYCPLLQSLLGALAVALLTTPAIELPRPRFASASAVLPWRHPSGLGSRGPPHAS